MEKEELTKKIQRIRKEYLKAPVPLKIIAGKVLLGDIKIKKSDEHN